MLMPISSLPSFFQPSRRLQKALHASTLTPISNTLKFSLLSRRPLLLQAHKPIPIPSYVPKFEGSSYSHTKRYDPDAERNAASKLKSQYKQERKGAIRELRKDARFLAGERNREKDEKDAACEYLRVHLLLLLCFLLDFLVFIFSLVLFGFVSIRPHVGWSVGEGGEGDQI